MLRGVELTISTLAHHSISLVNFTLTNSTLNCEIESLKQRNEGHQKVRHQLTPQASLCMYKTYTFKCLLNWELKENFTLKKGQIGLFN